MTIMIFRGPSLSEEEGHGLLPGAILCGPAACGDVYRAVRASVGVIGLVDGLFEHRLSVWHKEILWALAQGVMVFGGASMGALRAAELADFGMIGAGRIFDWYRSGVLESDDEVALAHEGAEGGYRSLSDPLVNIRATLERAVSEMVVGQETAGRLIAIARQTFYADRSFDLLIAAGEGAGVSCRDLRGLRDWLRAGNKVDLKRQDARQVLIEIREQVRRERSPRARPSSPRFRFQYTEAWHEFTKSIDSADEIGAHGDGLTERP